MKKIILVMVLVVTALPALVSADIVALQPIDGTNENTSSWPQNGNGWTLGWSFLTSNEISVTALGLYDKDQNGLGYAHEVGLWNNSGVLLGSVVVPTDGALIGEFRFASLTNVVTLNVGTYYVGALYLSSYASDAQNNGIIMDEVLDNATTLILAPGIVYDHSRFCSSYSLDLMFPDFYNSSGQSYFGPNFMIKSGTGTTDGTTSPTPEPCTLLLLGSGLAGLIAVRRKKKA
jgi:hypothetical protein